MSRCFLALLLTLCGSASAGEWRPAASPLMTRWAADVSAENPWPEYPRPQMARPQWVNLNGLWGYAIRPKAEDRPQAWDGEILVPFPIESALSGVKRPVSPEERLWYRRTFVRPETAEGARLLLHFGAVDWSCTVTLNGQEVGEHLGGYDPFSFDVTQAVRDGENELIVAVTDPTDAGFQPRGKQVREPEGIWYTAVTGIWQTVWLEPVPRDYIKSIKIVPDVDRGVAVVTAQSSGGGRVRLKARDAGREVASAEGAVGEPVELKLAAPKLWSPQSPHLYDLTVELIAGDANIDVVDSYFGMRKIEHRKDSSGVNRIWLNGEVIFQYGPLDQGWWPDGLYTPAADAALRYDIEMTKKLGMNMARKHVKCECDRWYYWCDKLGLLVWQDMPSGNSNRGDGRANFRRELKNVIDALHNHPSIVMWAPFNEGWGQHETQETAAWVKQYDPTRLVNEASGWNDRGSGDVSDMHSYPGPGMRPIEENRAVVLGEFGGLGMPVAEHTWQDKENWGYVSYDTSDKLTAAYVDLLSNMRPLIGEGLCAAVYTQTSDVEIEVNGLMTYDRALVKMDVNRIAAAAQRLFGQPPVVTVVAPSSERHAQTWFSIDSKPPAEWIAPGFDDSAWRSAPGGFGAGNPPGAVIRTEWNQPEIWLRRSFELDAVPAGDLWVRAHHDEDAEAYLNGHLIWKATGYRTGYLTMPCEPGAVKLLKPGRNHLAVHCRQTRGGQFIDLGLVTLTESNPPQTTSSASAAPGE